MVPPLDKNDAITLAQNILSNPDPYRYLGAGSLRTLANAVIEMNERIMALDPYGRGVVTATTGEF
jgi:hypothetical protein